MTTTDTKVAEKTTGTKTPAKTTRTKAANNLEIWEKVETTPKDHQRPITGKSYKGNSPIPQWMFKKATEIFGPIGIGWGFEIIFEEIRQGAKISEDHFEQMHVAKVQVWYEWNGKRGTVEHMGGTPFSGVRSSGKPFTDEDAAKKSITDALTKCLSLIGFSADIFCGLYDDSKYVASLEEQQEELERADNAFVALMEKVQKCQSDADLDKVQNQDATKRLIAYFEESGDIRAEGFRNAIIKQAQLIEQTEFIKMLEKTKTADEIEELIATERFNAMRGALTEEEQAGLNDMINEHMERVKPEEDRLQRSPFMRSQNSQGG